MEMTERHDVALSIHDIIWFISDWRQFGQNIFED